jgi:threonine/homoserine/homoserine lactone efflux protein
VSAPPLLLGFVAGFLGAIPPGPVGLAVAGHAAEGRARRAVLVGLGAALVDTCLSGAIALGAGPLLARATEPPLVRAFLAAAYAGLGIMLVGESLLRTQRKRRAPARGASTSFAGGVLRGIANPTLAANWAMLVAGLTASGLYAPSPAGGASFAIGVGTGVASYFTVLARAVGAAPNGRVAPWLRAIGGVTGAALVVAGGVGAARALVG